MEEDFCKNFICKVVEEFAEVCLTYFKGDFDIDCHLNCALANCSFTADFNTNCITYSCAPSPPGPTPTPAPPTPSPSPPSPGPNPIPDPSGHSSLGIGFAAGEKIKQNKIK